MQAEMDSPRVMKKQNKQQDHLAQQESQAEKIKTSQLKWSIAEPISTQRKVPRQNQNLIGSLNASEDDVLMDSN